MPYIKQEERDQLDPAIHLLARALVSLHATPSEQAGLLNYAITRLLRETLFRYGTAYSRIAIATGVLETIKLEMYRRLVAPYEDAKAEENGDVYAA